MSEQRQSKDHELYNERVRQRGIISIGGDADEPAKRDVQRRLALAGYRVVAPFMRGYPPTSFASDGDYSSASLGKDVLALVDALGEPSAVVVGHDWGASAVYSAIAQDPSKISKLVALSIPHPISFAGGPTTLLGAPHFVYYQLPTAERLLQNHDFAHIEAIYRQWAPRYAPSDQVMDDIKSSLRTPGATASVLGYYRAIFSGDQTGSAAAEPITVPALMITGDDGPGIRTRFEAARHLYTGPYEYLEIPGVGHFPQLEAPDETADAILGLLGPPPASARDGL